MKIQEDFVFPVYIYEKTIEEIKLYSKSSELEVFGYLVGTILKWNGKIYTLIEESLFQLGAIYSDKSYTSLIEGTAGLYQKKFQRIKKRRKNENLKIVGWWHSHPNLGCFLSPTDLLTQKYFFSNEYLLFLASSHLLIFDVPIRVMYLFWNRRLRSLCMSSPKFFNIASIIKGI